MSSSPLQKPTDQTSENSQEISVKTEVDGVSTSTSAESVVDYAQKTLNNLIGMYGYNEKVTKEAVELNILGDEVTENDIQAVSNVIKESNLSSDSSGVPILTAHVAPQQSTSAHNAPLQSVPASTYDMSTYDVTPAVASENLRKSNTSLSKPTTPYMSYRNKIFEEIKHEYPGCTPFDLASLISSKWSMLPDSERQVWQEEYEEEMKLYNQKTAAATQSCTKKQVKAMPFNSSYMNMQRADSQEKYCRWCKNFTNVQSFSTMVGEQEVDFEGLCSEKCFNEASKQTCSIEKLDARTSNHFPPSKQIQSTLNFFSSAEITRATMSDSVNSPSNEPCINNAPWTCFKQVQCTPSNQFVVGMKVEAQHPDFKSSSYKSEFSLCTITAVIGGRLLLHFDGAATTADDFWRLPDSDDIYPVGWNDCNLLKAPPSYFQHPSTYSKFVAKSLLNAEIAPARYFKKKPRQPLENYFAIGMKLEAVMKERPSLIALASVSEVQGDRIQVEFDGYPEMSYWCHYADRDLFPVGWCAKTGFPLQCPGKDLQSTYSLSKNISLTSKNATDAVSPIVSTHNSSVVTMHPSSVHPSSDHIWKDKLRNCVNVFINSDCFCGPYIVSRKLRNLQTCYSGTIRLVMKNLLEDVIKCAYEPKTVLGFLKPGRGDCVVTAVCKGITYKCSLNNIDRVSSLWRLLEQFADNLRCCPNIFSSIEQKSHCYRCNRTQQNEYEHSNREKHSCVSSLSPSSTPSPSFCPSKRKVAEVRRGHSCSSEDDVVVIREDNDVHHNESHNKKRKYSSASHLMMSKSLSTQSKPVENRVDNRAEYKYMHPIEIPTKNNIDSLMEVKIGDIIVDKPPKTWSISQLVEFVKRTDVSVCAGKLEENEIDGKAMLLLERDLVLQHMGIKLGPALKLLDLIDELKNVQKKFSSSSQ